MTTCKAKVPSHSTPRKSKNDNLFSPGKNRTEVSPADAKSPQSVVPTSAPLSAFYASGPVTGLGSSIQAKFIQHDQSPEQLNTEQENTEQQGAAPGNALPLQPQMITDEDDEGGAGKTIDDSPDGTVQLMCSECKAELENEQNEVQAKLLQTEPAQTQPIETIEPEDESAEPAEVGNGEVQTKLSIGAADGLYEKEADHIAEHVVNNRQAPVISPIETGSVSTKVGDAPSNQQNNTGQQENGSETGSSQSSSGGSVADALSGKGTGESLNASVRDSMESSTGLNFDRVRVHTNSSSQQANKTLRSRAFTHGSDIWLGEGESQNDKHLMAHELTHVVQQSGGSNTIHRLPVCFQHPKGDCDVATRIDEKANQRNGYSLNTQKSTSNDNLLAGQYSAKLIQRDVPTDGESNLQSEETDSISTHDDQDASLNANEAGAKNDSTSSDVITNYRTTGGDDDNSKLRADTSGGPLPATYQRNDVLERELVDATSNSPAKARKTEGGPTVLELDESASQEPTVPSEGTLNAGSTETINRENASNSQPSSAISETKNETREAIQQSLPPDSAALLEQTSKEQDTDSQAPSMEEAEDDVEVDTEEADATEESQEEESEEESSEATTTRNHESGPGGASTKASGGTVIGATAGREMVPPPRPQLLSAAIPERPLSEEEFISVAEREQSEEQDRAEVQMLLDTLRADAEQEKSLVNTEAESRKGEIESKEQMLLASVDMEVVAKSAVIRAQFNTTRANLAQTMESNRANIEADTLSDIEQVETETSTRISDVENDFAQRQVDLTTYAEAERQRPTEIATEEAGRADSELESAASEAIAAGEAEARRYQGDDDPKPDQRAAARKVGRDSAADIREKKPNIRSDLMSRAESFSGRYMEYAQSVNEQISTARDQLIPSLRDAAERAKASLEQGKEAALQAMESRYQVDLHALSSAESTALGKLQSGGVKAKGQISKAASQARGEIDAGASALLLEIDNNVEEVSSVVGAESEPYVPGINDMIEASRSSIKQSSATGRSLLSTSTATALIKLDDIALSFSSQAENVIATAQSTSDSVYQSAIQAHQETIASRNQSGAEAIAALTTQQDQVIRDMLVEVDRSIDAAREEIRGINDRFRSEIREAADESISEAIKPRTDDTETRAHEAAEEAGKSWFDGLLSAIGQIVVGLVILVVVALVVAAIAAAFGVILTAWTAVMIAGAILLAVGLILSIVHRAGQWDQFEGGTATRVLKVVGLALFDTVGGTGIYEGFSGTDILTGRELTDAEQTERGVLGWFTAISLVLGARAAIKGPPGGAYVRPQSLRPTGIRSFFQGWRGWRLGGLKALQNGRLILGEMYLGMRQGVRNIKEWVRTRLLGREPTQLPPELVEQTGNISDAETRRGSRTDPYSETDPIGELPYETPPEVHVVRPGEPLNIADLDPSKTYLWVIDPQGNIIIAPEIQPGFAPGRGGGAGGRPGVVKHGDLTPGVAGQYRGAARAGGELRFRNGQWVMDHNSSYAFARTDRARLGVSNLDAAHEALGRTGTDTSNIVTDPNPSVTNPAGSARQSPPVRRGAAPTSPVTTPTPRDEEAQ